jgi:hypothetical protein
MPVLIPSFVSAFDFLIKTSGRPHRMEEYNALRHLTVLRFQFIRAVKIWVSLVGGYQRLYGTYCRQLQDRRPQTYNLILIPVDIILRA